MDKMKNTLNSTLKRRKKIKLGNKNNSKILAAVWVDEELIRNIKLRSHFSRKWRYARKNKSPPEVIEQCKNRYLKQQRITSIISGDKKSQWEKKKITETWKDGKIFWKMIKELLCKNKELVYEAYVHTDEGLKEEIMDCENKFTESWKDSIYQKMEKTNFSFWYGENGKKCFKQAMEEELEQGNSEIMEAPHISEEKFVKVINNSQNGKASGIDNISAELMTSLIKK